MKLTTFLKHSVLLVATLYTVSTSISQNLYPVTMAEKVQNASLVAEGKVISQQSFWNPRHTMIFTSSKVVVYKVFKGTLAEDTIEVMTQGGSVGGNRVDASDLLTLRQGDIGAFFCYPNTLQLVAPHSRRVLYDVYSSAQGVLKYNMLTQTASAPFARFNQVETDLYPALQQATGMPLVDKNPSFRVSHVAARANQVNNVTITSFLPATVTAGTTLDPANNVLTITGSGFSSGAGSAAVYFDDADDGAGGNYYGVAWNDPLVISWSNTAIQLQVPTRAGTGYIIVQDSVGNSLQSATPLTVTYAVEDASFDLPPAITRERNLMNQNGSGGYTIAYSNSTAGGGVDLNGAPEKATFQRALTTWKEIAGYNITENPTPTSVQTVDPSDGVNTIMFDNYNTGNPPLPGGVLAVCYFGSSMCGSTAYQPQMNGFDIVIRNAAVSSGSASFTAGPCPPASISYSDYDLETVILHELGHSIGLGHINDSYEGSSLPNINPNKLMNYALVNGVRRNSPDNSAYQAALYLINPQGNAYGSCGLPTTEMVPLTTIVEPKDECPVSFPAGSLASGTSVAFDLVHTTSNKFGDPQYTDINCLGTGTGITNTAYYALKTSNSGTLSLTVTGYATTPAAVAACSPAGVELALYQVSSCPAGQAYPAPVACGTFNANGVVSLNGLAANTSYLLMADGIENTKATFTISFAGAALPITLSSFTGAVFPAYNQLYWTIDQAYNLLRVVIEKSGDGSTFSPIDSISAATLSFNGGYKDNRPLEGNNYYRLAIVNLDGSKDYSAVVLLKRKDPLLVSAYPNPVQGMLYADISGVQPGTYTFALYNPLGQLVNRTSAVLNSYKQTIRFNTASLPQGFYLLSVYDAQGKAVSNIKVEVK